MEAVDSGSGDSVVSSGKRPQGGGSSVSKEQWEARVAYMNAVRRCKELGVKVKTVLDGREEDLAEWEPVEIPQSGLARRVRLMQLAAETEERKGEPPALTRMRRWYEKNEGS